MAVKITCPNAATPDVELFVLRFRVRRQIFPGGGGRCGHGWILPFGRLAGKATCERHAAEAAGGLQEGAAVEKRVGREANYNIAHGCCPLNSIFPMVSSINGLMGRPS